MKKMTTITDDYLKALFKRSKSEAEISHLILPNSKIEKLSKLENFKKLQLMDLRSNELSSSINFSHLSCLRFLFLQNNNITTTQGFSHLRKLESLFLDFNKIDIVENLESCPLQKLSVKGQRLNPEKHLILDPKTMSGLANRLRELNISRNGLTSLRPLRFLRCLQELDASGNRLASACAVDSGLAGATMSLRSLDVLGNPLLKDRISSVRIIATLPRLRYLNGTEVKEETRVACRHLHAVGGSGDDDGREAIEARVSELPDYIRPRIDKEIVKEIMTKGLKGRDTSLNQNK